MNKLKVCFAYPWATFGGVERMLLNRGLAFRHFNVPVQMDLYFMHDAGGLRGLQQAIERYQLQDMMQVTSSLNDKDYDLVFVIDSPAQIEQCKAVGLRYAVECHTHYDENRHYLEKTDTDVPVIGPSQYFCELLTTELVHQEQRQVHLLRNLVPWDITEPSQPLSLPLWGRKPLLFMARLDNLKNPFALLAAYQHLPKEIQQAYMLVFCGPVSSELDLAAEVVRRGLQAAVVILPSIPFFATSRLLQAVAQAQGIFISCSRAESFGLSAAEAISTKLPVVLSDIAAHVQLLDEVSSAYTYQEGDSQALAQAIVRVNNDYQSAINHMKSIRGQFSATAFVEDWQRLIKHFQLGE